MIHWTWILFTIIVLAIFYRSYRSYRTYKENRGSVADIETFFWIVILIAFILVWGGIFWW